MHAFLSCALAFFGQADFDPAAIIRAVEAARPAEIAAQKKAVERSQQAVMTARKLRGSERKEELQRANERLEAAKKRLADLQNPKKRFVPEIRKFEVGAIGTVAGSQARVKQVIDAQNVIVELSSSYLTADSRGALRNKMVWSEYWIEGVETTAMADGKATRLDGTFCIVGNKTFKTANGSQKTLLRLERIDLDEVYRIAIDEDRKDSSR